MRKLIAGMRTSVDGKIESPEGYADWVDEWSDIFDLMPQVDACLLGAKMYPGYEQYWTGVQDSLATPSEPTASVPTPGEVAYARFVAETPHYVLSNSLTAARWPQTRFVRDLGEITALKEQPGKDIYLVGGAQITASLLDAGLVDELRLRIDPLIAGVGKALFATTEQRRGLELRKVQQLPDGHVMLTYGIG